MRRAWAGALQLEPLDLLRGGVLAFKAHRQLAARERRLQLDCMLEWRGRAARRAAARAMASRAQRASAKGLSGS